MKYATLEELEDKYIGQVGTPRRDEYEEKLQEEIHAYHIGEAIKQARFLFFKKLFITYLA